MEFWNGFNLKGCVVNSVLAWQRVTPEIIKHALNVLGITVHIVFSILLVYSFDTHSTVFWTSNKANTEKRWCGALADNHQFLDEPS